VGRPTWGAGAAHILCTNGRVRVGPVSVYRRGPRYYCYLRVGGHPIRHALATSDADTALEAAGKIAVAAASGRVAESLRILAARVDGRDAVTVSEIMTRFYEDRAALGVRPSYLTWLRWQRSVAERSLGSLRVIDVTRQDVVQCLAQRRSSKMGLAQYVRSICRFALAEGFATRNPTEGVRVSNPAAGRVPLPFSGLKRTPQYLTPDQVRLYARVFAGTALEVPFLLGVYAGLRISEILHLEWGAVSFDRRTVTVATAGAWRTKNGRARTLPLHPELASILWARSRTGPLVCPSPNGLPWTVYNVHRDETDICRKVGLPTPSPHVWRHTFGVAAAAAGIPLTTIQAWLGHSCVTTTNIYAHFAPGYAGAGIERISYAPPAPVAGG